MRLPLQTCLYCVIAVAVLYYFVSFCMGRVVLCPHLAPDPGDATVRRRSNQPLKVNYGGGRITGISGRGIIYTSRPAKPKKCALKKF